MKYNNSMLTLETPASNMTDGDGDVAGHLLTVLFCSVERIFSRYTYHSLLHLLV